MSGAARQLHTLLHNGKDCWEHADSETRLYYENVVGLFLRTADISAKPAAPRALDLDLVVRNGVLTQENRRLSGELTHQREEHAEAAKELVTIARDRGRLLTAARNMLDHEGDAWPRVEMRRLITRITNKPEHWNIEDTDQEDT